MLVNAQIIERIRASFLNLFQPDKFHHADIERVKVNDWTIERFVLVNKTEEAALKALVKAMEWRKSFGVNDIKEEDFPEEVFKIGMFTTNFKDKECRPILWVRLSNFHKSELSPLIKKYEVYLFEKLDSQTSNGGWAMISDSTGSGLSNVDMDNPSFIVEVIQNYYPHGPKYITVVDLPWILKATAKVIMSFMNEELRNSMKFIKKEELTQYMDPQNIPVHLNGSYCKELVNIPEWAKPLDQMPNNQFSSDQIKKFRSIFKAELK